MQRVSSPGVTLGYLFAGSLALSLWVGVGVVLLPLMLIMAALHTLARSGSAGLARAHHRWLAAHYLWSTLALVAVLILPLFALPALLGHVAVVFNTLAQAPHPLETLAAAWPGLAHLPTLIGGGLVFFFGWYVVTFWISLRLLRRGLRWAEGLPVR